MNKKPRSASLLSLALSTTCAFLLSLCALLPAAAGATEVNVVGLFPGKALISINGGAPRTMAIGQKAPEGVTLVSTGADGAVVDVDGKRRSLRLGEPYVAQAPVAGSETAILTADSMGHYNTMGAINGRSAQFMVDTGASMVWLSADLANRLGIPWQRGRMFTASTAGGDKTAYAIVLENVRIGNITLDKVDAGVADGAGTGETVLLGMTFLSRLTMLRDGSRLVLSRKGGGAEDTRDARPRLTIPGTGRGVFTTSVALNGVAMPFVVDTGASSVSIDAAMAQQLGIDYQKGRPAISSTANGLVRSWLIKFDSVAVGPITLYNVDGTVREGSSLGVGLLGMSFLNRVEMRREGEAMTLIKRF